MEHRAQPQLPVCILLLLNLYVQTLLCWRLSDGLHAGSLDTSAEAGGWARKELPGSRLRA